MAEDEAVGDFRGKNGGRLPIELAELLSPPAQHALNHPLRREIMRSLHQSEGTRSAAEIVSTKLPRTGVTLVNYHAGVLANCKLIDLATTEAAGDGLVRRYASTVSDDVQIIAVLGATEPLDHIQSN